MRSCGPSPPASSSPGRTSPRSYPVLWPNIEVLGIEAAAYLPLIAQAQPIGALGLLYRDKSGFSAEERNVLIALGSSIAQSLQRAMLYDQEHDLAEGLQQAMLPRKIPQRPRRRDRRPLPLGPDGPGHRRRLVRRHPAARRPGRGGHRRRAGPRHARRGRHGPAAHRAAGVRGRGPHPGHRDGPRLRLPARTGHRPVRDLHVRRGRPDDRRGPGRCAPGTWTPSSGTRTAPAAGSRWRAACRWACRPSSGSSNTRSPPSSWTPARRSCSAPTAWSSMPGADLDDGLQLLTALVHAGPRDLQHAGGPSVRRGGGAGR